MNENDGNGIVGSARLLRALEQVNPEKTANIQLSGR